MELRSIIHWARKYTVKVLELTENTVLGDKLGSAFMSDYYSGRWFRDSHLNPEKELKWSLRLFSNETSGGHGDLSGDDDDDDDEESETSRELFERRLADALPILNRKSVSRFLRISTTAYITHQHQKLANRTDPILREPEVGDAIPEVRGSWVNTLLSDNAAAFEVLLQASLLPLELCLRYPGLDLHPSLDTNPFVWALSGHVGAARAASLFSPWFKLRETAMKNLLRICGEHGLVKILQHLIANQGLNINERLDTGLTILQEVLEQGRTHHAISLLACGADLSVLGEKKFIQMICHDGHFQAIDFWSGLKEIYHSLRLSSSSDWMLLDHYNSIFKLFTTNDNMDFNTQIYQTRGPTPSPASPIYFSIVDNCWSAFLALLRYGVDPSKPCMGSLDALQTSVALIRPMFVAKLLGPGYLRRFNDKGARVLVFVVPTCHTRQEGLCKRQSLGLWKYQRD